MAKLSQQLQQEEVTTRPTRTERVKAQQTFLRQELEAKRLKEAQDKLSKANYDNYEQVYNSIDPKYRSGYLTPSQLKQTEGYQKYKREQEQLSKIRFLITFAQSVDRGNAFWGYGKSKSEIRELNAYRQGIGEGTFRERRANYLIAMFPDIDEGTIRGAVNTGTIMHFNSGSRKEVGGIDKGEVFTSVRRNKEGEVIESIIYTGTGKGGYTKETTTYLTGEKLKEAQEKVYQDFLKENPEVKLPKEQEKIVDDRQWYEKSLQDLVIQPAKSKLSQGLSWLGGKAKQGLDIADDYVRWDFKLGGSPKFPKVQVISFGKEEQKTDVEGFLTKQQEKISESVFGIKETEIERQLGNKYGEFKESKQEQADKEVTSLFYRSDVGKDAFFTAKTDEDVEKAFKEFQKSDTYETYQKQYSTQYSQELDKLINEEVSYGEKLKGTYAGLKIAGLILGSSGLSLVKSPTRVGLTAGALYTGGAVYSSLSTPTLVGIDVAFGTVGAVKTFSPSSSIEERGTGALMLGVSTVSLSAKGISYLRQPTVKPVEIKSPVRNLKTTAKVGKDLKVVTEKGVANKVLFQEQKLSQIGVAGRRTVVSTRWRDILGLDPIYRGVPYAQRGVTTTYVGLRGTVSTTSKSGYQKAFDLLTKRGGYTPYQASSTLRYIQPRIIEQYLDGGVLLVKGGKAQGLFASSIRQPVLTIDDALGIKTRGARTIKDITIVERKLVNLKLNNLNTLRNLDKVGGVIEKRLILSAFMKRGSSPFQVRGFDYSSTKSLARSSDVLKGYERIGKLDDLIVYKPIEYKNLATLSRTDQIKVLLKQSGKVRVDFSGSFSGSKTILIDETKVLKNAGFGGGGTKTPFSKTFGSASEVKVQSVKEIIKRASGGTTTQTSSATSVDQVSKTILKQAPATPKLSIKTQIKNLVKVDQGISAGVKVASLSSLLSAGALKSQIKSATKLDANLKSILRSAVETKQATNLKSGQLSATAQISQLLSTGLDVGLTSPIVSIPNIPDVKPPAIPPFTLPFPLAQRFGGKGKKKGRQVQDLAYLPDFTSRAIGLKAETLTERQAQAQLKKILTGLEIRRGIKIK